MVLGGGGARIPLPVETPVPPRVNLVSLTFLVGFALGVCLGVTLVLILSAGLDAGTGSPAAARVTPLPTSDSQARAAVSTLVYLGPGERFAVVGNVVKGASLTTLARDASSTWVLVIHPPGGTGRGWLLASEIENLQNLASLPVIQPSVIPQPSSTGTPAPTVTRGPVSP